ncbi:MAG: hypothetical protein HKN14_02430 [Marinicaulis sp.]|nr:hypothetical protein [Marinicaulis sp.]NNE39756.1 hypothetical protein [Marinicaulis sp.]NNL89945.1 hypothetical protein [Marinicaulis sp.]
MQSFTISKAQIARIVGAAIADELSRGFNRHFDFMTIASWDEQTPLGEGGIGMSQSERTACAARLKAFFGIDDTGASASWSNAVKIADWARVIERCVKQRLTKFSFKSAARTEETSAHEHNADSVFQDAAAAANLLAGRRRLLSLVAPHSLLGFVLTILSPNLLRIPSIDGRGLTADFLAESLSYGDVLIATPTLWRYMMQEKLQAPNNTMAVSFGEPMTADLASDMRKAGFGVLRELYGSTEAGLIGWRDSPSDSFVLFDHWLHDGEMLLRLAPNGARLAQNSVDFIDWTDERSFRLGGRRDGAVQIAAVNVFPDDVARRLEAAPEIESCRIRVGRRGDGVNSIIAHIILKDGRAPSDSVARSIDAWCRAHLRQQERPRIYQFEAPE